MDGVNLLEVRSNHWLIAHDQNMTIQMLTRVFTQ